MITNELVAHHTILRQLYAQSENDPKAYLMNSHAI